MDTWATFSGYMDFLETKDFNFFWQQHNEHRILLTKLIFALDYELFGGLGILNLISTYIVLGLTGVVFLKILRVTVTSKTAELNLGKTELISLASLIFILVFYWGQHENLTWAFQPQFVLVQLLPLMAFFVLSYSCRDSWDHFFFISSFIAFCSIFTMANGVLVLPLLFFQSICQGKNKWQALFILFLTFTSLYLYYLGYHSISGHSSITVGLRSEPHKVLGYTLTYIGGIFKFVSILGKKYLFPMFMGGVFCSLLLVRLYQLLLKFKNISATEISIVTFIVFLGGTAFGTAGGRYTFGLEQALSSRYITPSIMLWVSMGLLEISVGIRNGTMKLPLLLRKANAVFYITFFVLMVFGGQFKALRMSTKPFERAVSLLSLYLEANDHEKTKVLYPDPSFITHVSKKAKDTGFSVFGSKPFLGMDLSKKSVLEVNAIVKCEGHIDDIHELGSNLSKIRGWVFLNDSEGKPNLLYILDRGKNIVGYGFSGGLRKDVAKVFGGKAKYSGFEGYVSKTASPKYIYDQMNDCMLRLKNSLKITEN